MRRQQLIFGHILTLFLGGLIYISFRPDNLIMFKWTSIFDLIIQNIRTLTIVYRIYFPDWFIYSLPDGLWLFSYSTLSLFIWKNRISRENIIWIIIVPIIVIFSEFGQLANIVAGTFDFNDIVFYMIGAILPILFYTENFNFKNKKT